MPIPYRYYNIQPWEEKNLHKAKVELGTKTFIDNQDTHGRNWEKLVKLIEQSQGEVEIRSLVDIGITSINKALTWINHNPKVCNHVWGMEGESLAQLLARFPSDLKKRELAKKRWEGIGIGRPSKAGRISQTQALRAIQGNRTMLLAARALDVCPTLLWHIAKGTKGIPSPVEELEALGLTKFIPSTPPSKKDVANPQIGE